MVKIQQLSREYLCFNTTNITDAYHINNQAIYIGYLFVKCIIFLMCSGGDVGTSVSGVVREDDK